jgi:hypothetical protein
VETVGVAFVDSKVIAVPRGVRTSLDDLAGQSSRRRDARSIVASS